MLGDETKPIVIEERPQEYRSLFDVEWADRVQRMSPTKLGAEVFNLLVMLKGISSSTRLPLFAVEAARSFANGHQLDRLSNSMTMNIINSLAAQIEQEVVLPAHSSLDVKAAMLRIADRVQQQVGDSVVEFPFDEVWNELVLGESAQSPEATTQLQLAIWSTMKLNYAALFFAYEDFFMCLVGKLKGSFQDRSAQLESTLGKALAEKAYLGEAMTIARLARNAIVHAGGKVSETLLTLPHSFRIEDNTLQVMPHNLAMLAQIIAENVEELLKWASTQSRFR